MFTKKMVHDMEAYSVPIFCESNRRAVELTDWAIENCAFCGRGANFGAFIFYLATFDEECNDIFSCKNVPEEIRAAIDRAVMYNPKREKFELIMVHFSAEDSI